MVSKQNRASSSEASAQRREELPKVPTGISGLDNILRGGIPEGRLTIVAGGPGAGKTLFGLETIFHGAQAGRPGIFLSFEERKEAIFRNALSVGWDLEELEKQKRIAVLQPNVEPGAFSIGDFTMDGLLGILGGYAKKIGAKLVVVDAVDILMRLFENPERKFAEMYRLHRWLAEQGLTAIFTTKNVREDNAPQAHSFLDFMADCVILLDARVQGQVTTRRLRVTKYRGSGFSGNEHPCIITPNGIVTMPVTSIELVQKAFGAKVSTGISHLDKMMNGGFRQGSSVLITGPTGSGKTTLACAIANAVCDRGERVLYVSFEESKESLLEGMRSVGFKPNPHLDCKNMKIVTALPEAMGVEEHLFRLLEIIDEFKPQHMIVDAISAALRMGSQLASFDFLMRLVIAAKERGITCIYINQANSRYGEDELSGIGISSLIDTAIVLNYVREGRRVGRTLWVLKSRGSHHSDEYRRFAITGHGIEFVEDPQGGR